MSTKSLAEAKKLAERVIRETIADIRWYDVKKFDRRGGAIVDEALELLETAKIDIKWSR